MNSSNYITWELDPIIFTIPEFNLPFPLAIWGLVLGFILIYFGFQQIKPASGKDDAEGWKIWGIIIGALIVAQLPFLIIESPTLSSIGPIQPRWYGLMWVCAFASGYMLGFKMFKDAGRSVEELDRLLMYVLVATVIGARLGHVFFYEADFYLRNPALIPQVWTGGLASHGAAIGIIIAMYLFSKKTRGVSFLWVADRVVPGVAIGGMFIRIGNFFNSEIIGVPTDVPWAIIFTQVDMLPRHPSMLYEAILCLFVLIVLWGIYKKYEQKPPEGSLFATFLILLFGGRFFLEFTKQTLADFLEGSLLDMGQLLSIPLVLIGIWILWKKINWKK